MAIEKIYPETLLKAHGYVQVLSATGNRFVYTSGQVSADVNGELVGQGDYKAQGRQALKNVYLALEAAGASAKDIVHMVIYVVNPTEENLEALYAGLGEAGAEHGAKSTTSSLIGISAITLPGAVVEIEATALTD